MPKIAVIVEIFTRRYANGEGLRTIAKALNEKRILVAVGGGKRGTGSWSPLGPHFCLILRRTRYVGVIEWNRMEKTYRKGTKVRVERAAHDVVRVDVPHLRIVSDDLWAAAHAQMRPTGPGKPVGRPTKKNNGRPPVYLLSGLAKCGVCGGALTVINGRDGTTPIKVYVCSYHRDRGASVCPNAHRRPMDRLDAGVISWIKGNILSEELVLESLKVLQRRQAERAKKTNTELPRLEVEAHKLKAQIANLVDILASNPEGFIMRGPPSRASMSVRRSLTGSRRASAPPRPPRRRSAWRFAATRPRCGHG